ncbi:oxygenase MpaB family protein [soil metagenome]
MSSILPDRDEADHLIPAPGGVTWRLSSDARLMAGSGYALMLQVSHPVVGAGVAEHSNFKEDPWGRLLRTLDFTTSLVYGGPSLAWETCRRVREMHKQIKGKLPDGDPYHALDPDAYAWVHATLADAIIRSYVRFIGPISEAERHAFWSEWRRAGRLLGVRERDLPESWSDFPAYFDTMIDERLERTRSVDDVLEALAEPPPPNVKGLSDPLWKALRVPAARGARLGTVGLMSPALRQKLGLEWSRSQQLELRAVAAASRGSGVLLPAAVKEAFGPRYLHWRREAIARGEVASGAGMKAGGGKAEGRDPVTA